ncbi:MAG: hypothetical protein ACK5PT_02120 [Cereibacter sp.]
MVPGTRCAQAPGASGAARAGQTCNPDRASPHLVRATPGQGKATPAFSGHSDTGTPVNDKVYQVPFDLTGTIDSLKLVVDHPQLSDADKAKLEAAMKKAGD